MTTTERKKSRMTRAELAEALAEAMNLLNDLDRDDWTPKQLGAWHRLAKQMPEEVGYWNNGTVEGKDL